MNTTEIISNAGMGELNLEEEILSTYEDDTSLLRELSIKLDVLPGKRVRIYGWHGRPKGSVGPFATILHIHGGKQTAYPEHVRFWTERGFAAFTYDWYGPWGERKKYSDLSALPSGMLNVVLSPEESVMLTRLITAKSILSWLLTRSETDPLRIAAYGISWGGSITWLLNGYDSRLRAAAAIYGCGDHTRPGRNYISGVPRTAGDAENWASVLDPSCMAGHQNAPLLMLQATNDFWGWMDSTARNLVRIPCGRYRVSFSANYNHHLDGYAPNTLEKWMAAYLKENCCFPGNPVLQVENRNGKLAAVVKPDCLSEVSYVKVYYSLKDYMEAASPSRHWEGMEAVKEVGCYSCGLPVLIPSEIMIVFADVIYSNGIKVSSLPVEFSAEFLGFTETGMFKSNAIADFSKGTDGWFCTSIGTEPIVQDYPLRITDGINGMSALTIDGNCGEWFEVGTRRLSDDRWKRWGKDYKLSLWLKSMSALDISVLISYKPYQKGERTWKACLGSFDGWKEIVLGIDDFKDISGLSPECWSRMEFLRVVSNGCKNSPSPAVGTVSWI